MQMRQRIMLFCYTFAVGIGAGMFFNPSPAVVWPMYITAAIFGVAGWSMAVAQDQGISWIRKWMVYAALVVCAFPFGMARFVERAEVPKFDPERPNHIRAILEAFPDVGIKQTTRFVGKIISEPEYRPAAGKPGILALTIEPYEVEPEPGTVGKVYPCSGGNVRIFLRPGAPFRNQDREWSDMFQKLTDQEAYGYIVEIEAPMQIFREADNPGLFDAEAFNTDQDVYAQANIAYWNNANPPIKIIDENEQGSFMVEMSLNLKQKMLGVIKATVPFPESAFLAGVTLGARRGLDGVRTIFEPAPEVPEVDPHDANPTVSDVPDMRQYVLDQFRWSGTSHVLAVSGLHVTIIAGALWGLFSLMKLPQKAFAPFVCLGLATFCYITGAAPSSTRAAIMNSMVVLTYVYLGSSFKASLLLAIGASGFIILVQNPKWLIQPAFALSFMAVLSLGLITPPTERILKKIKGWDKIPSWIGQFISAQFAIQLGMMGPLSAYYFCRASMAGPFANFIAIPLIGIIVQLGIFACVLGMIPYVGLYLALVLNAANYIAIRFFLWVAHISTVLIPFPFTQTFTPPMMAGYYFLLTLFIFNKPLVRHARIYYYDLTMGIGGPRRRLQSLGILGGAFAVITAVTVYCFWPAVPDGKLHVNVLSVRYGQAIHVQTPSGAQILIDAGGNDYRTGWSIGERTIAQYLLKQRIGKLDAVIMTNSSPEDMGGLGGVFRIFPVDRFYSVLPVWDWDPTDEAKFTEQLSTALGAETAESVRNSDFEDALFLFRDLVTRLKQKWGVWRWFEVLPLSPTTALTDFGPPAMFQAKAGMVLWQEQGAGGDFEIVALHPNPEFPLTPVNNNSVVLMIRYGNTKFLLPSDLTEEGIRELLRVKPELLASDVTLIPAHGSAKSDIDAFYDVVLPATKRERYAILSGGWSSALKPPLVNGRVNSLVTYRDSFLSHRQLFAKEVQAGTDNTVQHLTAQGIIVPRTDVHGAILCTTDGTTLEVVPMISALERPEAKPVESVEPGGADGAGVSAEDARQRDIP